MKLIFYITKAAAGILGLVAGIGVLMGGVGVFLAIREGNVEIIIMCCVMIAVGLGLAWPSALLSEKADDLERKRKAKLAPKSGYRSTSYGDTTALHTEKDDEEWREFHRLQDDFDWMDSITERYGSDWTGYNPEKDYPDCSDYE